MSSIKRDSIFIVARTMNDSNAFKTGTVIGNYKDDNGRWIAKDSTGKKWWNFPSALRNPDYFEIIYQYNMLDIVYYLMGNNEDYQSVHYDIFADAVRTTFSEAKIINSLDDIYKYVLENLI